MADADKYTNFKEWSDQPSTWLILAHGISSDNEPLISRDCYENYVRRMDQMRPPGKTLADIIDISTCLQIAKNYASFQSYERAIKFGEFALKQERFHKETRACLSKWSKIHALELQKEVDAVKAVEMSWRGRLWTVGYRSRLKSNILEAAEAKISENRFDSEARDILSYYGREKWRPKFLFENDCAARIQREYRARRKLWRWQAAQVRSEMDLMFSA